MKPDFTGEWILNRAASNLTGGAAAMDSGMMWIEHRDPKCQFRMKMTAGQDSVEHAWESLSDGAEVSGGGVVSRLFWGGDALVFDCSEQSAEASWKMNWRYELLDGRNRLRASEQMRGAGRDQDNIWIFDRREQGIL